MQKVRIKFIALIYQSLLNAFKALNLLELKWINFKKYVFSQFYVLFNAIDLVWKNGICYAKIWLQFW